MCACVGGGGCVSVCGCVGVHILVPWNVGVFYVYFCLFVVFTANKTQTVMCSLMFSCVVFSNLEQIGLWGLMDE